MADRVFFGDRAMSQDNCIFCSIVTGNIQADAVHEDEHTLAFHDLEPRAPVHVLVIPKRHIGSVNDVGLEDREVMGALFVTARKVAEKEGVAASGYRVVMNTGGDAGQSVGHAHLHVLGGRKLAWPPG
jgi:histidine triad (HIT) family protein